MDGAPQVAELMDCLQLGLTNGNVRRVVYFPWCWLVENFSLLQADFESKELSSLCKAECNALQGCLYMGEEGSIVGEKKLSVKLLPCFVVGLELLQVEQAAEQAIECRQCLYCQGFSGLLEHHAEDDDKVLT